MAILALSGCGQDSSDLPTVEQPTIRLKVSQGSYAVVIPEDAEFHKLLNISDALDDYNAPVPSTWHRIDYDDDKALSVHVENCADLDLLDLIIYDQLDVEGRPTQYRYSPVCGTEPGSDCDDLPTVPPDAQRDLGRPSINHFAFSGICISEDGLDAICFITFLQKE